MYVGSLCSRVRRSWWPGCCGAVFWSTAMNRWNPRVPLLLTMQTRSSACVLKGASLLFSSWMCSCSVMTRYWRRLVFQCEPLDSLRMRRLFPPFPDLLLLFLFLSPTTTLCRWLCACEVNWKLHSNYHYIVCTSKHCSLRTLTSHS